MKNAHYRVVARSVLMDRGFDVRLKPGQGYLPGSRVIAMKADEDIDVAVKASQERVLSFTKQPNNKWRTLHAVDLVVAIVPAEDGETGADVFAFEKKPLVRVFNKAWKALEDAKRPLGFNIPVFVPIDEVSRKNVGHGVGNLKSWRAGRSISQRKSSSREVPAPKRTTSINSVADMQRKTASTSAKSWSALSGRANDQIARFLQWDGRVG